MVQRVLQMASLLALGQLLLTPPPDSPQAGPAVAFASAHLELLWVDLEDDLDPCPDALRSRAVVATVPCRVGRSGLEALRDRALPERSCPVRNMPLRLGGADDDVEPAFA